jgi:hypothetical protein
MYASWLSSYCREGPANAERQDIKVIISLRPGVLSLARVAFTLLA